MTYREKTCDKCGGTGKVTCEDCQGEGGENKTYGGETKWYPCGYCKGTGEKSCSECNGWGKKRVFE